MECGIKCLSDASKGILHKYGVSRISGLENPQLSGTS